MIEINVPEILKKLLEYFPIPLYACLLEKIQEKF